MLAHSSRLLAIFLLPGLASAKQQDPDFRLGSIFDYDQREIIGTRQQNKTLLSKIHYIIVYFCRKYTVSLYHSVQQASQQYHKLARRVGNHQTILTLPRYQSSLQQHRQTFRSPLIFETFSWLPSL